MKKLCIFDFDGTLFDSITDVTKCFNETLETLGYEKFGMESIKRSLGGNVDEIIELILKEDNTPDDVELVKNTFERIYEKNKKDNTKFFKGMHEILKKLEEENYILAINSNRKNDSIIYFVEKFAPDINFIEIEGHVYNHPSKPDAYGVNTIINKAGVKLEDSVYIGDSSTDIETAKNAGIDCILVRWGYGVDDVYEDEYPVSVADNAVQLYELIKKI